MLCDVEWKKQTKNIIQAEGGHFVMPFLRLKDVALVHASQDTVSEIWPRAFSGKSFQTCRNIILIGGHKTF